MSKVMALVVTPVCVSDLILYEASAAPTQMKGKQVKKRKVMALVFGQSWVPHHMMTQLFRLSKESIPHSINNQIIQNNELNLNKK